MKTTLLSYQDTQRISSSKAKLPRFRGLIPPLVLSVAIMLAQHSACGQGWVTVDDFQYLLGNNSTVGGVAATGSSALCGDAQGNMYVAGVGFEPNIWHGLVMVTGDQGATWSVAQDYVGSGRGTDLEAIGVDAAQNLYASGSVDPLGSSRWIVQKSADHGATWTTVMSDVSGFNIASPTSVACDSVGNVLVSATISTNWMVRRSGDAGASWATVDSVAGARPMGMVSTGGGVFVVGNNGIVRKSADGGVTWTTVDTSSISPVAICADPAGNLYLGAYSVVHSSKGKPTTTHYWIIRKGSAGGTVWQTIATVPVLVNGGTTVSPLYTVGSDANGNIYAAGAVAGAWVVRQSADHGVTWTVVDSFQYVSNATPAYFARDAAGNLYIGGRGEDAAGTIHWIVRKHLAP